MLLQEFSENTFFKNIKWSPDGCILLGLKEDNEITTHKLTGCQLEKSLSIKEGDSTHDIVWYPFMNSSEPASCCFLSCSKDTPVHLWDSNDGRLRASYSPIDHLDQVATSYCLSFDLQGSKIYCGTENSIKRFDLSYPGRDFVNLKTIENKRSIGQKGVISSIRLSHGIIACGSFQRSIGLYDENSFECIALLEEHRGGITNLEFSSCGNYLYSSARNDDLILVWDIRNSMNTLFKLERESVRNQRVFFDVYGRNLFTGDSVSTFIIHRMEGLSISSGMRMESK